MTVCSVRSPWKPPNLPNFNLVLFRSRAGMASKNQLFHKNCFFDNSGWNWGGLEVSRMTAPSIRSYMQIFSRFGLTWHRQVNFSTFSGKLTFQCSRNGFQNPAVCPGSLRDTFLIYFSVSYQNVFKII